MERCQRHPEDIDEHRAGAAFLGRLTLDNTYVKGEVVTIELRDSQRHLKVRLDVIRTT